MGNPRGIFIQFIRRLHPLHVKRNVPKSTSSFQIASNENHDSATTRLQEKGVARSLAVGPPRGALEKLKSSKARWKLESAADRNDVDGGVRVTRYSNGRRVRREKSHSSSVVIHPRARSCVVHAICTIDKPVARLGDGPRHFCEIFGDVPMGRGWSENSGRAGMARAIGTETTKETKRTA